MRESRFTVEYAPTYPRRTQTMSVELNATPTYRMWEWVLDLEEGKCLSSRGLSEDWVDFPQVGLCVCVL